MKYIDFIIYIYVSIGHLQFMYVLQLPTTHLHVSVSNTFYDISSGILKAGISYTFYAITCNVTFM